jgi:hypothetical protein
MVRLRKKAFLSVRSMEREANEMYPILALLGLMFLTWGAAIWTSVREEKG